MRASPFATAYVLLSAFAPHALAQYNSPRGRSLLAFHSGIIPNAGSPEVDPLNQTQIDYLRTATERGIRANATGYSYSQAANSSGSLSNAEAPQLFVNVSSIQPPGSNVTVTRYTTTVGYTDQGHDQLVSSNASLFIYNLELTNEVIVDLQAEPATVDCDTVFNSDCVQNLLAVQPMTDLGPYDLMFQPIQSCVGRLFFPPFARAHPVQAASDSLRRAVPNPSNFPNTNVQAPLNFTWANHTDEIWTPQALGNNTVYDYSLLLPRIVLVQSTVLDTLNGSSQPSYSNHLLCARPADIRQGSRGPPSQDFLEDWFGKYAFVKNPRSDAVALGSTMAGTLAVAVLLGIVLSL